MTLGGRLGAAELPTMAPQGPDGTHSGATLNLGWPFPSTRPRRLHPGPTRGISTGEPSTPPALQVSPWVPSPLLPFPLGLPNRRLPPLSSALTHCPFLLLSLQVPKYYGWCSPAPPGATPSPCHSWPSRGSHPRGSRGCWAHTILPCTRWTVHLPQAPGPEAAPPSLSRLLTARPPGPSAWAVCPTPRPCSNRWAALTVLVGGCPSPACHLPRGLQGPPSGPSLFLPLSTPKLGPAVTGLLPTRMAGPQGAGICPGLGGTRGLGP